MHIITKKYFIMFMCIVSMVLPFSLYSLCSYHRVTSCQCMQVTTACKKHGGFYLGSIGGPAAILAQNCIKRVEVLEYPELGQWDEFYVNIISSCSLFIDIIKCYLKFIYLCDLLFSTLHPIRNFLYFVAIVRIALVSFSYACALAFCQPWTVDGGIWSIRWSAFHACCYSRLAAQLHSADVTWTARADWCYCTCAITLLGEETTAKRYYLPKNLSCSRLEQSTCHALYIR